MDKVQFFFRYGFRRDYALRLPYPPGGPVPELGQVGAAQVGNDYREPPRRPNRLLGEREVLLAFLIRGEEWLAGEDKRCHAVRPGDSQLAGDDGAGLPAERADLL